MIARLKFRTRAAQKRERIRLTVRTSLLILGVTALITLVWYVLHLEQLRIQDVYVTTDGSLDENEIIATVKEKLQGSLLGILPHDSALLDQNETLEEVLSEVYPRIATVYVRRAGFLSLSVEVKERTPVALWCGDVVPPVAYEETSEEVRVSGELWGTCYLVDKTGYIYARAPVFSGNAFPRYYGSLVKAEPLAQQYLPEDEFTMWQSFYQKLDEEDITPQALLFVDERDAELYLASGLRILVLRSTDPTVVYDRLLTLLDSDIIDPEKEVRYVDFRYGNKVYVKYMDNDL